MFFCHVKTQFDAYPEDDVHSKYQRQIDEKTDVGEDEFVVMTVCDSVNYKKQHIGAAYGNQYPQYVAERRMSQYVLVCLECNEAQSVYDKAESQFGEKRQRQNLRLNQIEAYIISQCKGNNYTGHVNTENHDSRYERLFFDFVEQQGCDFYKKSVH
jgi:hypothetical protein